MFEFLTGPAMVKLAFGLAAFVLIAYVGTRSKRIAGVLLTFPILNGSALLTGADPFRDTVLFGPLLVIPFNAAFAEFVFHLPGDQVGTGLGMRGTCAVLDGRRVSRIFPRPRNRKRFRSLAKKQALPPVGGRRRARTQYADTVILTG